MFRFALAIFLVAVSVQAKTRTSRLPDSVWKNPVFRKVIDEKIVGGDEVIPHSIPYQVSLQYRLSSFHFCGGSVVNKNFVLTAAHCCYNQNAEGLKVVAGDHNLFVNEGSEQEVRVSAIHIHPDYISFKSSNDVCLLELAEPLSLNSHVSGVELPSPFQSFLGKAVVSGWGTLSSGGSSPDVLQKVEVPLVSDEDCRKAYGEDSIDDSMICAGEEGKDSCQGDSGGPMTCGGIHCGVVSWGYGCALAGYPGVYAETSHFSDFINEHVEKHV